MPNRNQFIDDFQDMADDCPRGEQRIAALVNQSLHSRGSVFSVRPASVARPSRSTGDSLNRKLFTSPTTWPFSTR